MADLVVLGAATHAYGLHRRGEQQVEERPTSWCDRMSTRSKYGHRAIGGPALVLVCALHTVVSVVAAGPVLAGAVADGWVGSFTGERAVALWFSFLAHNSSGTDSVSDIGGKV